jgi:hypothetical protein
MMAPTLVVMVRLLWLIVRHHRHELYWMVAELTFGKHGEEVVDKMLGKEARLLAHSLLSTQMLSTQLRMRNRPAAKSLATRAIPEVRGKRVESQTSRQTPDHHSRPQ